MLLCPPLFVYVVFIEPYLLRLRKNKVGLRSRNFASLKGLRILHLSDLHIKKTGRREKKILEYANQTHPHLILLTGDYLDYSPKVENAVNFIRKLKAPLGVFGNIGNVDYACPPNVAKLKKALPDILLINKKKRVLFDGEPLWIVSIDDPILYKRYSLYEERVTKLISSLPENEPYITLIHRPEQIPLVISLGAEFILCGHTHGGQMKLPFSLQFYNQSEECKKYSKGIFVSEGYTLNVSAGIGTSDIPMRFLCPPEVVLLEFI